MPFDVVSVASHDEIVESGEQPERQRSSPEGVMWNRTR
jgi:hypothetical protein